MFCIKYNLKLVLVNNPTDIKILLNLKYIDGNNQITELGNTLLDNLGVLFKKTKVANSLDLLGNNFLDKINEYKNYFPKNKRSTTNEIKEKFVKLFIKNPNLKWDDLLNATKLYFSEDREEKYIYKASNFIMVERSGINTSPILEYHERILEGENITESKVNMYKFY